MDDPLINSLLVADEMAHQMEAQEDDEDEDDGDDEPSMRAVRETHVGAFEDFVVPHAEYVTPPEIGGDRINGPGRLNQLMLESPTSDFEIEIVTDGTQIVKENFSDLMRWSDGLTDIDAFEVDGNYLFSAQDYSFDGWMSARLRTPEEVVFPMVRIEADVEKMVPEQ